MCPTHALKPSRNLAPIVNARWMGSIDGVLNRLWSVERNHLPAWRTQKTVKPICVHEVSGDLASGIDADRIGQGGVGSCVERDDLVFGALSESGNCNEKSDEQNDSGTPRKGFGPHITSSEVRGRIVALDEAANPKFTLYRWHDHRSDGGHNSLVLDR